MLYILEKYLYVIFFAMHEKFLLIIICLMKLNNAIESFTIYYLLFQKVDLTDCLLSLMQGWGYSPDMPLPLVISKYHPCLPINMVLIFIAMKITVC